MSNKLSTILINGQEREHITVLDRGLQYGDGLFETIRITTGIPHFWQQHIDRLLSGCLRLKIPEPDQQVLHTEAMKLCKDVDQGVLKIIITRGAGGRGYSTPEQPSATRILAMFPSPGYSADCWKRGIVARLCDTRLGLNPSLAGLKHLNRLEQVLARAEWHDPAIQEGLMLDADDNVIEGTMSNLFCVIDNELSTPDLSHCGVKGVIRDQVIKIATQQGMKINETNISLNALYGADEVFITNSLIGIWPVRQLEYQYFSIGTVTLNISEVFSHIKHGIEDVTY